MDDMLIIKNSENSPLRIAEIPFETGCLGLTICPGKQGPSSHGNYEWERNLETDINKLREWGAGVVLTLMETDELARFSVPIPKLQSTLERAGIEWEHFPFRDGSVPLNNPPEGWHSLSKKLRDHMSDKGRVLIHCLGGLGRTGLITALLLIDNGEVPDKAINRIRRARPGAIERWKQEDYVRNYLNNYHN